MNEEGDDPINNVVDLSGSREEDESSYFSEGDGDNIDGCRFSYSFSDWRHSVATMRIECYDYGIREVKISESSKKEERCPIEEAGKAIGDSLELKEIDITLSHSGYDDPVIEIFQGMSRNRSIELVKLRSDVVFEPKIDVFQVLIPFFEHNDNLRCMELYRARSWTLKHLPAALSACKNSQLQRINMINIKASDKIIVSFFGSLSTLHFLT